MIPEHAMSTQVVYFSRLNLFNQPVSGYLIQLNRHNEEKIFYLCIRDIIKS